MSIETVRQPLNADGSKQTRSSTAQSIRWGSVGQKSVAGTVTAGLVLAVSIGFASPSFAALPAGDVSTVGLLGSRPGATRLPIPISDQVSASLDVGTGNLQLSVTALSLPGISGDVGLGMNFNSLSADTSPGLVAPRWTLTAGSAGTLSTAPTGILFTSGDGFSALFTPVSGSATAYTSPPGVKADLVKTGSTGWTLTSRTSATVVTFNLDGKTTQIQDRNSNATALTWASGKLTKAVSTRGVVGARTANLGYDTNGLLNAITQTSGASTRSVSFAHDAYKNLTGFTDLAGKNTTFTYSGGRVATITSPTGAVTTLSYDSAGKVTQVQKTNTTAGSPGDSITRLTYPTASQTLLAGPNTHQGTAVSLVPHTTYILTSDKRVSSVTDEMGRTQAKTYTGDFDTLTATQGAGTTAGTVTNTFGANTGESITASQAPGGAAGAAAYANTAANTAYLATSSTDDAGNQSLFTFNGAGNQLTSTDALAATATLSYNTNGTVATALAPGNGSNKTAYGYDGNFQLSTLTPVTGSSLGARTFTYDPWGRALTATNGRGVTLSYAYDGVGRLTSTTFSDSTPTVTNTYNNNGQPLTRVDGSGTTSYGYDQMGRLISRANTAGGGTINYSYDRASNLASTTDSRGTTTYQFDASSTLVTLTYQHPSDGPKTLAFATDDRGRRTDTWLQANPSLTTWKAHTHTDYDTTGRVTRVTSSSGNGDTDNTLVMDQSYCYSAGSTAPTCPTTAAADRSKIQWVNDNLTGSATAYTYDGASRLTKAATSGGTAPAITYNYSYDARGNRLTASTTGATTTNQTFTVNAANQITSTGHSYDGTGNLTADPNGSYAYNGADQMTTVTKNGASYQYSYAGTNQNELLSQTTATGTYQIAYGRTDAQGLPVIEQYKKGSQTAYVENDPVTGQPLMLRTSSGMVSLYVYDGTGNPAALLTSGPNTAFVYQYDPYGVPTLTEDSGGLGTSQNPYTFKAGIQDRNTGWVKYGQRWYAPTTGRWSQQDTLDTPLNPANANRYAYAANDPINNTDPTGLVTGKCILDATFVGIAYAGLALSFVGAATATGGIAGVATAGIYISAAGLVKSGFDAGDSCE
ncbi:RHS repeat-associated core domain-containing protein [Specibacter sp. NPDC078692]|uniref:RHS repeat domain-containing protein n=1 Tax=Specibacter sp. NPDC078692 TaxID=3155818 RepID=UPI00343693CA